MPDNLISLWVWATIIAIMIAYVVGHRSGRREHRAKGADLILSSHLVGSIPRIATKVAGGKRGLSAHTVTLIAREVISTVDPCVSPAQAENATKLAIDILSKYADPSMINRTILRDVLETAYAPLPRRASDTYRTPPKPTTSGGHP